MAKKRNIIVGQSGGPTSVINSSLAGVYKNAIERGFDKVYGMLHGVQGLLDEQYVDLSTQIHSELDIELLKRTPSAFLGSCRYKLPEIHEDRDIYEKLFGILNKLSIDTFIYIGGNDSMDTIKKLSDYAILTGQKQKFIGVPKTIDNDLALTDHTPGFGSAAKYIGASTKEVIRDAEGLTYKKKMITIMEIMGRNAGWLTGAAALAKTEDCEGPDLIYLPEIPFDVEKFLAKVKDLLTKKDSVVIAVSEGIKLADGRYVCELGSSSDYVDNFGHKQLQGTAAYLANFLAGECADEVTGGFRMLTGKAAMLPRWAFGYIQSQERYESAVELVETAKRFRQEEIPLDALVLDWMSWKGNLWGQKTFDGERFPDPADMIQKLHEQKVHFMISIWPNMSELSDNYQEFLEKGLLLPASEIYDAFSEEGRRLYWEQAERGLFRHGVDAWWCDSSEPVTPEWGRRCKPEPGEMYREFVEAAGNCMPLQKATLRTVSRPRAL